MINIHTNKEHQKSNTPFVISRNITLRSLIDFPDYIVPKERISHFSKKTGNEGHKIHQAKARAVIGQAIDYLQENEAIKTPKEILLHIFNLLHQKRCLIADINDSIAKEKFRSFRMKEMNPDLREIATFVKNFKESEPHYLNFDWYSKKFRTLLQENLKRCSPSDLLDPKGKEFELSSPSEIKQSLWFRAFEFSNLADATSSLSYTSEEKEEIQQIIPELDWSDPGISFEKQEKAIQLKLWEQRPDLCIRLSCLTNKLINFCGIHLDNSESLKKYIIVAQLFIKIDKNKIPLTHYILYYKKNEIQDLDDCLNNRELIFGICHQQQIFHDYMLNDLSETLEKILKCNRSDVLNIQKLIGYFQYQYSQMTPFFRGSASIGEWLEIILYLYHGLSPNYIENYSTNLDALSSPFSGFIEEYLKHTQVTKIDDDRISRIFRTQFLNIDDDHCVSNLKQEGFDQMSTEEILNMVKKTEPYQLEYARDFFLQYPEKGNLFLRRFVNAVSEEAITDELIDWIALLCFIPSNEESFSSLLKSFSEKDPDFLHDLFKILHINEHALQSLPTTFYKMLCQNIITSEKQLRSMFHLIFKFKNNSTKTEELINKKSEILKCALKYECEDLVLKIAKDFILMQLHPTELLPILNLLQKRKTQNILRFLLDHSREIPFPHLIENMLNDMYFNDPSFTIFRSFFQKGFSQEVNLNQLYCWLESRIDSSDNDTYILHKIFRSKLKLAILNKDEKLLNNLTTIVNNICQFTQNDLKSYGEILREELQEILITRFIVSANQQKTDETLFILKNIILFPSFFSKKATACLYQILRHQNPSFAKEVIPLLESDPYLRESLSRSFTLSSLLSLPNPYPNSDSDPGPDINQIMEIADQYTISQISK